jgi:uncharacterized SAM-binding protein YcdF (DUF218 family)
MTKLSRFLIVILLVAAIGLGARRAGNWLVLNDPHHADVIVVLAGDLGDIRFQRGLELLREGYAQQLVLDAPTWIAYGRMASDLAREYVKEAAPDQQTQIHVCSFHSDSTLGELREVAPCLQAVAPQATTALLVTSDFHTRRALSIARRALPQYKWSVAATPDRQSFGTSWWRNRDWAKTTLLEWQKLCWWELVERWRKFGN